MAGAWERLKAGVAGWTFSYVRPVLRVGYRQPLQSEDLPHLTGTNDEPSVTAGLLKQQLRSHKDWWHVSEAEAAAAAAAEEDGEESASKLLRWYAASGVALRMWAVFLLAYWPWLVRPALCKLFGDLLGFVPPLCLNQLLLTLEYGDSSVPTDVQHEWRVWDFLSWSNAYFYAAGIFLAFTFQSILLHQHHNVVIRVGMWARSSLSVLVYEKCLRLSVTSRAREGSGKISTLLSTDAAIIEHAFWNGNYIWSAPLQITIAFVLLFREASIRKTKVQHTDSRVSHTSECMSGIRVLKLYSWEFLFGDRVLDEREKELSDLRKIAVWRALNDALLTSGPTLVTLAAFTFYGLLQDSLGSDPLTAAKAFTSLSLFNLLRLPLLTLPDIFVTVFNSFFSMRRFRDVLCASEAEALPLTGLDAFMVEMERVDEEPIAISVMNGVFSWETTNADSHEQDDDTPLFQTGGASQWTLEVESLRIPRGYLTMIVGPVGSGKSRCGASFAYATHPTQTDAYGSVLSAILKDMVCLEGKVELNSTSVAFCAQQPWILNATVRENILFGRRFEAEFYDAVVFACALQTDFLLLPHGDSTEIGEKGVNLSGGQRARVSLARAVYAQADLILLDDVLAAVDANVGEHILRHCIMGLLEGTTRVLVTNGTSIRDDADWIVCMDSTTDVATGNRQSFVREQGRQQDLVGKAVGDRGENRESPSAVSAAVASASASADELKAKAMEAVEDLSVYFGDDEDEDGDGEQPARSAVADNVGSARVTEDEDRATGQVRLSVLGRWLAALPLPVSAFMLVVLMVQSALSLVMYWWLSAWSGDQFEREVMYYVLWYAVISFAVVGMIFVFRVIMALCGVLASRRLHEEMLLCILRAPTSFFDKTPMGRIINRFTSDFYVVDEQLAAQLANTLSRIAAIVATLLLLLFLVPWLAIVLLPSLVVYVKMQQYYSASSRELRRLDKITKSPVFHAISEVVDGMTTIRAFRAEERFEVRMGELLEYNLRSFWYSHQINRWLGIRLEVIGAAISSAVACAGIFFRSSLSASFVGLMVSQSLSMSSSLNWTIRSFVELETQLTSVERIGHFTSGIEQEYSVEEMVLARKHNHSKAGQAGSLSWTPDSGTLDFQEVTLRYKPTLPPALDGISFHLDEGEKAGVCGRTGAGKSSLIQALFRLVEVSGGCIKAGGVDTSTVPLHELRSALTVIPQEPLLFSGTVRYNLDPFRWYSDADLWRALEDVELKAVVTDLGNGLDSPVTEGGRNFSVGQRQLLCIARAVLRNSKIVVFDEATAAVDVDTDELVQRMLRQVFASSTCLTIAHRLNTVMDSSSIIVMDAGQVLEQASPRVLLEDPTSAFAGLVHAAGIEASP